jgi:hypothetical protein
MNAVKKYFLNDFLWMVIFAGGFAFCNYLYSYAPMISLYRESAGRFATQIFPIIFFLLLYGGTHKKYSGVEILIAYFRTFLLFCLLVVAILFLIISSQVIFKSYPTGYS